MARGPEPKTTKEALIQLYTLTAAMNEKLDDVVKRLEAQNGRADGLEKRVQAIETSENRVAGGIAVLGAIVPAVLGIAGGIASRLIPFGGHP